MYVTLNILDSGHLKLGAIKSTLPEVFKGFAIEEITQSGFVFDPENVKPPNVEVSHAEVAKSSS